MPSSGRSLFWRTLFWRTLQVAGGDVADWIAFWWLPLWVALWSVVAVLANRGRGNMTVAMALFGVAVLPVSWLLANHYSSRLRSWWSRCRARAQGVE